MVLAGGRLLFSSYLPLSIQVTTRTMEHNTINCRIQSSEINLESFVIIYGPKSADLDLKLSFK